MAVRREELEVRLDKLASYPMSPERHVSETRLRWKIELLEAEQTVRALRLAPILLDAYERTGAMSISLPDGRRLDHHVNPGGNDMDRAYNATGDARSLAFMATGERPPLPLAVDEPSR
jgi:hypothetical protein